MMLSNKDGGILVTSLKKDGILFYTESLGGGAFDYFKDKNISKVGLFGSGKILKHLIQNAKENDIEVFLVTDQDLEYEKSDETNKTQSNYITILISKPHKPINNSIPLKRLLMYSLAKQEVLNNLINYQKQNNIDVILLSLPSLAYVRKKNAEEIALFKNYGKMTVKERKKYLEEALALINNKEVDSSEKLIEESQLAINKDKKTMVDRELKYVTMKNNLRIVPSNPKHYDKRVFILGNSVSLGMYTDNYSTIANVAQIFVNENNSSNVKYKFINIYCGPHPNFKKMWEVINQLSTNKGDIIVLASWFSELFDDNRLFKNRFSILSPQKDFRLFDRPHKYGKYIWADNINLLKPGYIAIGNLLGRKILENDNSNKLEKQLNDLQDVLLPEIDNNSYWEKIASVDANSISFVRKNALVSSGKKRWLSFEIKKPLKKDVLYMFEFTIKYDRGTRFIPFIHDSESLEKLETQTIKGKIWTEFSLFYRPKRENMTHFSFTASHFFNPGEVLSIKEIKIKEALHLYD